jgi:hypothetical protein
MRSMSTNSKIYIGVTIFIGLGLLVWMSLNLDWLNTGLYLLAILGAVFQTLKLEGPNARTNYSIAWFVYGFTFLALGLPSTLFVITVAHLVEWVWHKYPWYIQSFNIGNHVISAFLAGLVFAAIGQGPKVQNLQDTIGMVLASMVFVSGNHLMVGLVVKLARGQSFSESGVFGFLTLFLDFTILSMGAITALVWSFNPFASILNALPLYLLYNAIRVPALKRQLQELKETSRQLPSVSTGD